MNAIEPTDEELARRAAGGDREALGELIGRHCNRLAGYLRFLSVPPDDIDDVMQDVWMKVIHGTQRWQDGNFTWVMRIANNAVIDRRKRKRLPSSGVDPNLVELRPATADPDARAKLKECLERLNADYRAAVVGHAAGKSYEELAEQLDTTIGTVKSRISRGRAGLKQCLGPYAE